MNERNIERIILSFLIKNPHSINNPNYPIKTQDFLDEIHRMIFNSMCTLYEMDTIITYGSIIGKIQKNSGAWIKFAEKSGEGILTEINNINIDDYTYDNIYNDFKKNSLFRELNKQGIKTDDLISPTGDPVKDEKMVKVIEGMTHKDVLEHYRGKLASIEDSYERLIKKSGIEAGEGLDELLHSLEEQPEMGLPLNGDIFNTMTRGARRKKVYINSASSGSGKSRAAIGNAAKISIPYYYDEHKEDWVYTGMNIPTLVITTELEHLEVQTMILAYVSGINEEKILNNKYSSQKEKERVIKASQIIKEHGNTFIEFIPDPSIDSVSAKIRIYAIQKDVEFVFYDYVHVSAATYVGKKDMRDDVWLMLFVDKLKQLANELDIHISTATQVNASSYEDREVKNESMIRGAKSIADKADVAYITSNIIKEQEKAIARSIATQQGTQEPNQIIDIYKNRRGKWRSVRLWRYTDLGTCRTVDCFATDLANNPIDIVATKVAVQQLVKEGSFPIVDSETGEIVEENRKVTNAHDF